MSDISTTISEHQAGAEEVAGAPASPCGASEVWRDKVRDVFGSVAIDKSRLPSSPLKNRSIPGYVAEWVLDSVARGEGPLSSEEVTRVEEWATRVIPGASEANGVRDKLWRGEVVKVLTKVEVEVVLTRSRQERVAHLESLQIRNAQIIDSLPQQFPALLDEGLWGITELIRTESGVTVIGFKPMQASVDLRLWKEARREFSLAEWRALLLCSMGYAPDAFKENEQKLLLCRLLPLVHKNVHQIELAPKGTGKSFLYENVSPRVRLVGGNVTPAKLFVDNARGTPGYLARYKVVVLDEVQTLAFTSPDEIIANLKMYLANAQIQRGTTPIGSDCGFVMLANIALDESQQPLHQSLLRDLPAFMREAAFLDRLCGLLPGWRIRKLSSACFARGWGLKADFFGDTLLALREDGALEAQAKARLHFGDNSYTRNEAGIRANAVALFKLLFPHGEASEEEFEQNCLTPAVKLRQGIWDELWSMDAENRKHERNLRQTVRSS